MKLRFKGNCRTRSTLVGILTTAVVVFGWAPGISFATITTVTTTAELAAAMAGALPGDEIVLAPGDYLFNNRINVAQPGTATLPITVRAEIPGCARLLVDTSEAFNVQAPHWIFEGLEMEGICADPADCEHAFHVVGEADFFVLRDSRIHEFNAMVKGNGEDFGMGRVFPDDVVIERNHMFNSLTRNTSHAVIAIDVVGGRRWVVRENFIHDLGSSIHASYGAFLKGNSRDGLIEGNVVACRINDPIIPGPEKGFIIDATVDQDFEHTNNTKIWYAHGVWWCIAQDDSDDDWFIYKNDEATPTVPGTQGGWTKTGANPDTRTTSQIDLWFNAVEDRMHVLRMHGDGATYNEYVWNAVTEEYELDTILGDVALGFTSKEACIALDSTGQAYVAYEQAGDIVIEHSTNPTRSAWSSYVVATGTVPGVGNRAALMPYTDSVSGGQVGLLYFSDSSTLTFRLHDDDAADGPGVWTGETVDASITANDHTCLRSHAATGDLFAVVKNAMDDVILYKRPDGGSWGSKTIVTTGAGQVTRPQLVLDEDADEVHVFWTNWIENTIVHKKAPIGTLIFGEETVVIAKPGESVNNVQLSKHGVGSVTGLMVTAASSTHTWYNGPDKGGARIGLSFGGGGTSPDSICEDETCTPEHQNGIMRNNIIVNCNDVGIYLNDALNCEIHNNTLYGNLGIDVRYEQSIVDLRNNLLTGQIRERNGGTSTTGSNIEEVGNAAFEAWFSDPANFDLTLVGDGSSFVDQGEIVSTVSDDFCGGSRDAPYDIGAVEYDLDVCDTTERLSLLVLPPPPPPTGPADTLRLAKSADRQNVDLFWMPGPDAFWNVYRDGDPAAAGQTPLRSLLATPFTSDIAALNDPAPYFYVVRGVAACTGDEAD